MEKGGGVGTHPLFAYNFHGDVACLKRYIFGFYPEKGIYFSGVLTIIFG